MGHGVGEAQQKCFDFGHALSAEGERLGNECYARSFAENGQKLDQEDISRETTQ